MELTTNTRDIRWWFWAATLGLIVAALMGVGWAYAAVMALSAVHWLFFVAKEQSLMAFPTQIRAVYFLVTLCGLWPAVRLPVYAVLLLGTIMVTFFGRCAIALVLRKMPWNEGRELRLN